MRRKSPGSYLEQRYFAYCQRELFRDQPDVAQGLAQRPRMKKRQAPPTWSSTVPVLGTVQTIREPAPPARENPSKAARNGRTPLGKSAFFGFSLTTVASGPFVVPTRGERSTNPLAGNARCKG